MRRGEIKWFIFSKKKNVFLGFTSKDVPRDYIKEVVSKVTDTTSSALSSFWTFVGNWKRKICSDSTNYYFICRFFTMRQSSGSLG